MLAILSPAKSLDYETRLPIRLPGSKLTQPRLLKDSQELIDVLVTKSPDELADLMSISPDLAELNAQRYADFSTPFTPRTARAAVYAFNGDVYQGMNARERFGMRDLTEAQKTVRILSGLYGVLRPLDLIQPYRLEMGSRLRTDRGQSLYDFWGSTITDLLAADVEASPGSPVLVNLASEEYVGAVDLDTLRRRGIRTISPRFEDQGPKGDYRIVSFFAKRARGELAGWLVTNRVRTAKALTAFDGAGYAYVPELSRPDRPVFRRPRSAATAQ